MFAPLMNTISAEFYAISNSLQPVQPAQADLKLPYPYMTCDVPRGGKIVNLQHCHVSLLISFGFKGFVKKKLECIMIMI